MLNEIIHCGSRAGILLDDCMLLHHMYGVVSQRVPYGGCWRERTVEILRHIYLP